MPSKMLSILVKSSNDLLECPSKWLRITRLSVPDTATDSFARKPRVSYKTFTALTIIWEL